MTDPRWPGDAAVEAAVSAFHAPLHNMTVLDRMRAALLAADRAAWQDISTAPRSPLSYDEGPTVLLLGGFVSDGKPTVRTGHWKAARTNTWCDTVLGRCPRTPTHWRPLPADPAPPAQGDGE